MKEDNYLAIRRLFSQTWDESGTAQNLIPQIEQSRLAYEQLFSFVNQTENSQRQATSSFIVQLRNTITNFHSNLNHPSSIIAFDGDILRARLTIKDVQEFIEYTNPTIHDVKDTARAHFVDSTLGAIVAECSVAVERAFTTATIPLPVLLEAVNYITLKGAIQSANDINSTAAVQLGVFEERYANLEKSLMQGFDDATVQLTSGELRLQEIEGKISNSEAAVKQLIEDTQQRNDDLAAAIKLNHERLREMETQISAKDADIKAHASALREELKIEATRLLWKKRAFRNSMSFWLSVVVLIVAVGVPTLLAWAYKAEVLTFIDDIGASIAKSLPENANSIQTTLAMVSHLLIVTLPLAFFIWMLKLIVRFNQRALALYDDAAQRNTMMDTYFHLIEKGAAEPQDRALILTALFRPGPGQSNDIVEPPNFADLMDSMKFKPS